MVWATADLLDPVTPVRRHTILSRIIEPSEYLAPAEPLIIVTDALDERGDVNDRVDLLDVLSSHVTKRKFPANLRFLITIRPGIDILDGLPSGPQVVHIHMGDEDVIHKDDWELVEADGA